MFTIQWVLTVVNWIICLRVHLACSEIYLEVEALAFYLRLLEGVNKCLVDFLQYCRPCYYLEISLEYRIDLRIFSSKIHFHFEMWSAKVVSNYSKYLLVNQDFYLALAIAILEVNLRNLLVISFYSLTA